jgi:hypothetical protein
MSEPPRRSDLLSALGAAVSEQAATATDRRLQQQAQSAGGGSLDRPRPLEFDTNGFPVSQRSSSFATRVAWLLDP